MISLRCESKLHGILLNGDLIEVSCNSFWCGKRKGNVVKHKFNLVTGELVETNKYKTLERSKHDAS